MQHIKSFKLTPPTAEQLKTYESDSGYMPKFLTSEDGQDWYACQALFADDTIKVMYDGKGVIRMLVAEPVPERGNILAVSMLYPLNCSVVEVDSLPAGCDISGAWLYKDGEVTRNPDFDILIARGEYQRLLRHANDVIAILERKIKYNMANEGDKARLESWEKYTVLLSQVNLDKAPDLEFPPQPE